MKKIIALRGKGNSGKTTTIRLLPRIFHTNEFSTIMSMPHGIDFSEIFEKGNLRVGITSAGDSFDLVIDRLQELMVYDCQVYICACRSFDRGVHGTNGAINSFSPPFAVDFVEKTVRAIPSEQASANGGDAEKLFAHI